MILLPIIGLLCLAPFAALYWLSYKFPADRFLVPDENMTNASAKADLDALRERLSKRPVENSSPVEIIVSEPCAPVGKVVYLHRTNRMPDA